MTRKVVFINESVKNILIVRKHNQIGDMICSLPLYAAVRKKYPLSKITLVASPTNYPIPFKEINPFIDEVLIYDKSSFSSLTKFYFQLWKKSYQISIVPSTIRLSFTSHIISFLSGAKLRVGIKSIDGVKNKVAFLLNRKADFNWVNEKVHQSVRNLDIAHLAGCDLSKEEFTTIKFTEVIPGIGNKFLKQYFPLDKMIIGFHPGAGQITNIWKQENYIDLIKQLYKRYNNYVFLTRGPLDDDVINKLTEDLNKLNIPWVVNNELSLSELISLLDKIDLFINTDTGIMHIAGSSSVKQISLFGPGKAFEWAPRGTNKYFIQSATVDINDISMKEVLDLCITILGD
jgi:ADP-heptose:LPS heptosyltransferase